MLEEILFSALEAGRLESYTIEPHREFCQVFITTADTVHLETFYPESPASVGIRRIVNCFN